MCSKFWFSRCREKFENITQIETNGQIKRPSFLLSSLNFLERRYGKAGTLVIFRELHNSGTKLVQIHAAVPGLFPTAGAQACVDFLWCKICFSPCLLQVNFLNDCTL